MRFFSLMVLSALFLTGCDFLKKHYKADNPLEEFVEDIIEEKSGWKVDLSPWETEKEIAKETKKGKEKENERSI